MVPSHSNQPVSSHFLAIPFPPAITINQNRSQYLILVEWCSGQRERGTNERANERRGHTNRQREERERWERERERERENGDHGGIDGNWCNNASNAIKYTTCRAIEGQGGFKRNGRNVHRSYRWPSFVVPFVRWFVRVSLVRIGHSTDSFASR